MIYEEFFEKNRDKILRDLDGLIAIPSESHDLPKVREALHYVLDLAKDMGMRSSSLLDDQIGIVETGQGDETCAILVHVDVVSTEGQDEWETDPFKMTEKDGRLYGRGTLDDKGMVIASLYAMKALMESGITLHKTIRMIIGTQEEIEWTDINEYVKHYPMPDYGFTPDGEYPLCNIEKGVMDCVMKFTCPGKEGGIKTIKCGTASNIVPGKAEAVLQDGDKILSRGKAIHSCQPELGDNALFRLRDDLKEKADPEDPAMKLLVNICEAFSDPFGSGVGLYSDGEYYQSEFVHRNAMAPTVFRYDGETAELNVNVRFPYGESAEHIEEQLRKFAENNGGTVTACDSMPAVFVSKDKPFIGACIRAYEKVTGLKSEFALAYGGSYAKAMPNIVSWGPIFVGEEDTCHEPNEYIAVSSLLKNGVIFSYALEEIAGSTQSFR